MSSEINELLNVGYDDFFSELSIACIVLDKKKVIKCNGLALSLFGLVKKEELEGKNFENIIVNHQMEHRFKALLDEVASLNHIVSHAFEEKDCSYYMRAKQLENNRILIAVQDRTQEKQYDQLLLNKMQLESVSHLAAGVAHELRNPLSVIQGFIQLATVTGNFNRYSKTILSETKRMNQIIEDFLSIARKKVDKQYIKANVLLESITALIHSECLLHGITFDFKLYDQQACLYVNENMMKQVMLNLLRNTIEAYGTETKNRYFRLHAGSDKNEFVFIIEDNGPGMSEEVISQLNKPFFTTKDSGTGIGIPMCRKMVKEHDGIFSIESTQDKGTKIIIRLPLHNLDYCAKKQN